MGHEDAYGAALDECSYCVQLSGLISYRDFTDNVR